MVKKKGLTKFWYYLSTMGKGGDVLYRGRVKASSKSSAKTKVRAMPKYRKKKVTQIEIRKKKTW